MFGRRLVRVFPAPDNWLAPAANSLNVPLAVLLAVIGSFGMEALSRAIVLIILCRPGFVNFAAKKGVAALNEHTSRTIGFSLHFGQNRAHIFILI